MLDPRQTVLVASLEGALQAYTLSAIDDRDNDQFRDRLAATYGLKSVVEYLKAIGIEYRLCRPLEELLAALNDASVGIPSPLLKPEKFKSSASRMGTYEVLVWTRSVAAVRLLMDAGDRQRDALLRIAPVASEVMGRTITTRALLDVFKRLTSGQKIASEVVAEYRRHLRALKNAKSSTPRERAERAIAFLKRRSRKRIAPTPNPL